MSVPLISSGRWYSPGVDLQGMSHCKESVNQVIIFLFVFSTVLGSVGAEGCICLSCL